jgi:hypothetical protein
VNAAPASIGPATSASAPGSPVATTLPAPTDTSSSSPLPLVLGIIVVAGLLVGFMLITRRRRTATDDEE